MADAPSGYRIEIGGFRALAADLMWVSAYQAWQERDLPTMRRRLGWVGAIDPRPLTFWLNGARMLGFDAAAWAEANNILRAQARQAALAEALDHLATARRWHGARAALAIEEAVLHWRLGEDREAALHALERASACADAPYFVGRLRGEMLVALGREAEALAWLREFRATLPADDEAAEVEVVDRRIARLETARTPAVSESK